MSRSVMFGFFHSRVILGINSLYFSRFSHIPLPVENNRKKLRLFSVLFGVLE